MNRTITELRGAGADGMLADSHQTYPSMGQQVIDAMDKTREAAEQDTAQPNHGSASMPSISLPKSGGAIKDISQQFKCNPVTGTGSLPITLPLSRGREGFGPSLSLQYDSGSGNGIFGFGWNLAVPSVTRRTSQGVPRYDDLNHTDVFILSGIGELVSLRDQTPWEADLVPGCLVQRYISRVEKSFSLIQCCRSTSNPSDVHWRLTSPDNILSIYGKTQASRVFNPEVPDQIFEWFLSEVRDDRGNAVIYRYKRENGVGVDTSHAHEVNRGPANDPKRTANVYLKRAMYGNLTPLLDSQGKRPISLSEEAINETKWLFEAVLDFGEHKELGPGPRDSGDWDHRSDAFSSYKSGFEIRTTRLCKRFLMFHHFPNEVEVGDDCLVQSLSFVYSKGTGLNQGSQYTLMSSVSKSAYRRKGDGYLKRDLPSVDFTYTLPHFSTAPETIDADALENLPAGFASRKTQWIDLFGEGVSSLLTEFDDIWYYKRNVTPLNADPSPDGDTKPMLRPVEIIANKPRFPVEGVTSFADLSSGGILSVIEQVDNTRGFYKSRQTEETWDNWKAIPNRLNSMPVEHGIQSLDISGDGIPDIIDADGGGQSWRLTLGEDGFGDSFHLDQCFGENDQDLPVFSIHDQGRLRVADFSGDGLSDIVRIFNGEVCYWPNLGYGRFAQKVTMDNSPWFDHDDLFNVENVILADVDGSGTSDIIYLHRDCILIYVNVSGNEFMDPIRVDFSPKLNGLDRVTAVDIHGNGTASLVFSTPYQADSSLRSMQYIRLMGSNKPYLMTHISNNMGAETRINYTSSTTHYLRDKEAGNPWVTRLPFPVNVVASFTVTDLISRQRSTTKYAYHHGYFDPIEREFRGFGMVEQWDTEAFGTFSPEKGSWDNESPETYLPPVHTKSWFHLGVQNENSIVPYDREFYMGPHSERASLLNHGISATIGEVEWQDACQALAGTVIRTELYADDAEDSSSSEVKARSTIPYAITESNYQINLLQSSGTSQHASFFVAQSESVSVASERDPFDSRCAHSMVIERDKYGNVLKEIDVTYGRSVEDNELPTAWDREQQTRTHMLYKETKMTNDIYTADCYRLPAVCETTTYEMIGFPVLEPGTLFDAEYWTGGGLQVIIDAKRLSYHEQPEPSVSSLRILQKSRTLFRADNLSSTLPLAEIESLALPGRSYSLAFTLDHVSSLLQRDAQPLIPDLANLLTGHTYNHGGYVTGQTLASQDLFPTSSVSGEYWVPSGEVYYSLVTDPAAELALARDHFFLPLRFKDAFGSESFVQYDDYDLLLLERRDAMGNRVTSGDRDAVGTITNRNDYRVLEARVITDINRNRSEVAFDTLGMVVGSAVHGKKEDNEGDLLLDFDPDLDPDVVQSILENPLAHSQAILGHATSRQIYDFFSYSKTRSPAVMLSLKRTTYDSDGVLKVENIHHEFSYFRGGGSVIQVKSQVEAGSVPQRDTNGSIMLDDDGKPIFGDASVNPRWISSGWGIVNNKCLPVQVFDPFFSDIATFEPDVKIGQSTTTFYDALGRPMATLNPDGTYSKALSGPWKTVFWDENDTVLDNPASDLDIAEYTEPYFSNRPDFQTWYSVNTRSSATAFEKKAAAQARVHANTPSVAYLDSLGRQYIRQSHNRTILEDHELNGLDEKMFGRTEFSIDGKVLATRDSIVENGDLQGRIILRKEFDMLGQCIYSECPEKGRSWALSNVQGKPLRTFDEKGHEFRFQYDTLGRLTASLLRGDALSDSGSEVLYERFLYGDNHPEAERRNLRGKVFMTLDQAGAATTEQVDFKGNPLKITAHLAKEYKKTIDWSGIQKVIPSDPKATFSMSDIESYLKDILEENGQFVSTCTFDGMGRMVSSVLPHMEGRLKTTAKMEYGIASLLKVSANIRNEQTGSGDIVWTPIVISIEHDALGQRQAISYGNGVVTEYLYDVCHRLKNLRTKRSSNRDGGILQDLTYTHDAFGNATAIEDNAQQTQFFRNQVVTPNREYTYDALYRLIQSTGRERLGQNSGAPVPYTHDDSERFEALGNVSSALARYTEQYVYDSVSNMKKMKHDSSAGSWTREFTYAEPSRFEPDKTSNRLSQTSVGNKIEVFKHDVHGNTTRYPHLGGSSEEQNVIWDFKDRISQLDLGGGGKAYYRYNIDGLRVRKVVEKGPNLVEKRTYIGEMEIFQKERGGDVVLERETIHMVDDTQRIAMVERRTLDKDNSDRAPAKVTRYQLTDHQHSACIEVDGSPEAKLISYEEYSSYGSTTYQARSPELELPKRYRFTSRERDEESGLSYHGARYLAPWLARWASVDPAGLSDGPNLYVYVNANPVRFSDRGGRGGDDELEFDGLRFERQKGMTIEELPQAPRRFGQIDEVEAVGAPGISSPERYNRATDIYNRHIEDGIVNMRTKGVRTNTRAPAKKSADVNIVKEPHTLLTSRLGDIPQFRVIFNWLLGRTNLPSPNNPDPTVFTELKDNLNKRLRKAIRSGRAKPIQQAAEEIRQAIVANGGDPETLSFDPNKVPPPGEEAVVAKSAKPASAVPEEAASSFNQQPKPSTPISSGTNKSSALAAAEGEAGFAMSMSVAPATTAPKGSLGKQALKAGGTVVLVLGAAATIEVAKEQVEKGDYAGAISEVGQFAAPVIAVAKFPKLGGPLVLLGTASHAWGDEGIEYGVQVALEWSRAGHSDIISAGAAGVIVTGRALKQTIVDDTVATAKAGGRAIWNWIAN